MKVIIEQGVEAALVSNLIKRLEEENFSEACCIGTLDEHRIYVRCPHSMHGVISPSKNIDVETLDWILSSLKLSLHLKGSE